MELTEAEKQSIRNVFESQGWKLLEKFLDETINEECNLRKIPWQDISVKNDAALKKASGIVENWINKVKGKISKVEIKADKYR